LIPPTSSQNTTPPAHIPSISLHAALPIAWGDYAQQSSLSFRQTPPSRNKIPKNPRMRHLPAARKWVRFANRARHLSPAAPSPIQIGRASCRDRPYTVSVPQAAPITQQTQQ